MERSQPAAAARRAFDWPVFLAHMLFLLAAWTIFINYLFPLAFAAGHRPRSSASIPAPLPWPRWALHC